MYKLIGTNSVKRLDDGAYIPLANGNSDYEIYKQWLSEGNTPEPQYTAEELLANEQAKLKQAKLEALAKITVTTQSGKVFDGRDIDQQRMVSAILSADVVGITETQWKLADNTVTIVSLSELKEALTLGIQAVGSIIVGGN